MSRVAYVTGVGMTAFEKPGRPAQHAPGWDYPDMAREAGNAALADAGLRYEEVQQVVAGYVYGDSCSGNRAAYELGETGVPVYNVNSNCSTGSSALLLARQIVESGVADVVLAVGFEKMAAGALTENFADRTSPLGRHLAAIFARYPRVGAPMAIEAFGAAGREHMERYGTSVEQFAKVAVKNSRHSVHNPRAQFQTAHTLDEVLASASYYPPLTKLQCSPTSDGGAAAVVMSAAEVARRGLSGQAVRIAGQAMVTDLPTSFDGRSAIAAVGADMTREAARRAYEISGWGPEEVQVIELHDCFTTNEIITYEALGLCPAGSGGKLVDEDATTYGGQWVVNPSGGLLSKGHPLGATGLAQCAELAWQLRGLAGPRQVPGAQRALQHNIGLGGAAVVTLYEAPAA